MPLYKREDSPFWWADVRVDGQPRLRVSTNSVDRREAQRICDELKAELWKKPRNADVSPRLSTVVLEWCRADYRGEPDILAIKKFMRIYGNPTIVEAALDRDGIDKALRLFVTTPGNYTRYRARLLTIFNIAKFNGLIPDVPMLRKWEVVRTTPANWIREDKFPDLIKELADHQRPMVLFATHTGLRQSNVLGLAWDQVDLERRIAWVDAINTKANKTITVPLNDVAVAVLQSQLGQHKDFVFTYKGRPISEIKTAFQKACVRAGLGEFTVEPAHNKGGISKRYTGLRWHDLRHTFASWHAQNGTPMHVIKELGGWSSMQMVERYTHLSPSFVAGFVNNIHKEPK